VAGSLTEIERDYDVSSVTARGEQAWPILRWHYAYAIDTKTSTKSNRKSSLDYVEEAFYGLRNWYGKTKFLFFSDSEQSTRRFIDGEYYDRLVDPIIDELTPEACLLIETPAPKHRPKTYTHTKRIASITPIEISARILVLFEEEIHVEKKEILEKIQATYGIIINDEKILRLYNVKKRLYNLLYKRLQPHVIFFVEYYRDIARVKAAKELSIKTIEVQHGSIGSEHPAYNSRLKIDSEYYPDLLFAYGEGEKQNLPEGFIYKSDQIYPVGNFLIDYINESYQAEKTLQQDISNFRKSAAITLQKTIVDETLRFVLEAAELDDEILFIIVPREPLDKNWSLPRNVRIVTELNFYQLMTYVDVHVTVFSSCAMEAPSLGVRNILVNLNNYAKIYYGQLLKDETITRYVDTPHELVNEINMLVPIDRNTVMQANSAFITPNYRSNLKRIIKELKLLDCNI
jgi:hypothetical protein